ncbi:MAG TPA: hypothetical protein VKJ00_14670 [Thermoanaerobaculia bacterium]|nr:hypothetical protein [Thermoanaerobaculia bacterium]
MALRIARSIGTLLLFALILVEIARRGPLLLPPATVASNIYAQPSLDPYLIFLKEAGRRIPSGAAVAVVPQASGEVPTGPSYLLALSQMPEQTILPITSLPTSGAGGPEWVLSFGTSFDDPRFQLVAAVRGGRLFQAVR